MKWKKTGAIILTAAIALGATPVQANGLAAPAVFVDGTKLTLPVAPRIVDGTTLVPMRAIFEAQGAEVTWDDAAQTVTAAKEDVTFTYKIGDTKAYINGQTIDLPAAGRIVEGSTLVPLRLISEALGSIVVWDEPARTIRITVPVPATVEWGVNLRDQPNAGEGSKVYRMLQKGERIQVLEVVNAEWLKVAAQDGTFGYISANPKYTDYTSPTLTAMLADEILRYGEKFLGTPYEFGASPNQTETFDCSSFVKHVYEHVLGIELPRVSYNQAEVGQDVSKDELRKGDLLFFKARGLEIGHVGIYAGDGKILHTFSKDEGVTYSDFDEQWEKRFVKAKRVV